MNIGITITMLITSILFSLLNITMWKFGLMAKSFSMFGFGLGLAIFLIISLYALVIED